MYHRILLRFWVKVKCTYCVHYMNLCSPKRKLEANLRNHLASTKHIDDVETSSMDKSTSDALHNTLRGKPSHSSCQSVHSNHKDLHILFRHSGQRSQACDSPSQNKSFVMQYLCWGLRGPLCSRGGKQYCIDCLFHDAHACRNWYA